MPLNDFLNLHIFSDAEEERLLIETIKTNHIADHGDELKMK